MAAGFAADRAGTGPFDCVTLAVIDEDVIDSGTVGAGIEVDGARDESNIATVAVDAGVAAMELPSVPESLRLTASVVSRAQS